MTEFDSHSLLRSTHIDFSPTSERPHWWRFLLALAVAVGASLGVDFGLVHAGTALFPSTRGFSHFRFSDYGTLTCVGVFLGAAGWPLVIRMSSTPRWLYYRSALVVTLVAWAPDVWLLARGETPRGVAVLAVMHVSVALITYNALVHLAPERELADSEVGDRNPRCLQEATRLLSSLMLVAVTAEFVLGVLAILFVPFSRPNGWLPSRGRAVFLVHGAVGGIIFLLACAVVAVAYGEGRIARIASMSGLVGIIVGAVGGLLAASRGLRLAGMAAMFVGTGVAIFGYLVPIIEPLGPRPVAEADAAENPVAPDEPAVT